MSITPEPGTIIDDRFEIIDSVGEGGMGSVYRARQVGLNRIVALKLLHSSLIGDADSRMRFRREGKVLSTMSHPSLPVFYHFGLWQSQLPYIAMEYLEGMSLRRIIDEQGRLPWSQVVTIGLQASQGVAAAHANGVTHRDLKPNNIMLVDTDCQQQQVKIVDFGLASVCEKPNEQKLTNTGMLIGSVHYISPEQCIGRKADQRSDIYSLACVLYEALAGTPPLTADNPIGLMHKHAHESPKPLQDILNKQELPPGLEAILFKAMQKDPQHRYQSMNAMSEDLALIAAGQQPTMAPVIPMRSHRAFQTGTFLLALLVVPALLYFFSRSWFNEAEVSQGRLQLPRIERKQHGLSLQAMAHTALAMTPDQARPALSALRERIKANGGQGLPDEEILQVYSALCVSLEATDLQAETPALMRECIDVLKKRGKRITIARAKVAYADQLLETDQILQAKTFYNDALRDLIKLNQQSPLNGQCYLGLARCAEADGRYSEAIPLLDRALSYFLPNKNSQQAALVAYSERLLIDCTTGDTTHFESDLKKLYSVADELDKEKARRTYLDLERRLCDKFFPKQASQLLTDLLHTAPKSSPFRSELLFRSASYHMNNKHYKQAFTQLEEALNCRELPPSLMLDLKARLATCYYLAGQTQRAIEKFSECTLIDERSKTDWLRRDSALMALGAIFELEANNVKAKTMFEQIGTSYKPNNSKRLFETFCLCADSWEARGRLDVAISIMQGFVTPARLRSTPYWCAIASGRAGALERKRGDFARAAKLIANAIEQIKRSNESTDGRQNSYLYATMGNINLQQQEIRSAAYWFKRAIAEPGQSRQELNRLNRILSEIET